MKAEVTQIRPVPRPKAHIAANSQNDTPKNKEPASIAAAKIFHKQAHKVLTDFIEAKGDITHLLTDSQVADIGSRAVSEYDDDLGSISAWRKQAEHGLTVVAQDAETTPPTWPFEGASAVQYPLIQTASYQWGARAYPEIIRGETVVGVRTFAQTAKQPTNLDQVKAQLLHLPQPPSPDEVQAMPPEQQQALQAQVQRLTLNSQKMIAQATQADAIAQSEELMQADARQARAQRVADYMNWVVFNRMEDWEGDTDSLLNVLPVLGSAFKKVYMGPKGLCSDFVSAMNLTVPSDTKTLETAARITHDYTMLPVHIEQAMRSDRFREVDLQFADEEEQVPRKILEQLRYEDLDNDGLPEPYLVTVDEESSKVLRIEPAFGMDDIHVSPRTGRIARVECYCPYSAFKFLPDPRGNFYATGFAKLLDNISQSIDSTVNQLIDAGTAEIAGGGFLGSNVRLQQDGTLYMQPGEYRTVQVDGATLRDSIYERTMPKPSEVSLKMLTLLIESAKEIASIKDVMTGEGNQMAPVGTTLAMQDQALKVFSSIYKRVYRGFKAEFQLMFECLKRFATEKQRREYKNLTGGDLDEDFNSDGTDIEPVADPQAVSMVMKIARNQALIQLAESPIGEAAGMTQAKVAQELVKEFMTDMGIERPDRFVSDVAPNQAAIAESQAKTQEVQASASLKAAQAEKAKSGAVLDHAKTVHEVALAAEDAEMTRNGVPQREAEAVVRKAEADIIHTHAQTLNDIGLAHKHMADLNNPAPEGQ